MSAIKKAHPAIVFFIVHKAANSHVFEYTYTFVHKIKKLRIQR